MKNFVDLNWLKDHIYDDTLKILDVRESYKEGHIPGAISMEMETKLTGPLAAHGGRHPFPKKEDFLKTLQEAGLALDDPIVCYDEGEYQFAGRLWLMLRYVGFKDVKLLKGGFQAWKDAGFEVSKASVETKSNPNLTLEVKEDICYTMEQVRDKVIPNQRIALVDSRSPERYRGEVEPLDKRAGHIPSALNYPYDGSFKDGEMASLEELKRWYKDLFDYDEVVVYCGSGITATVNLLLMEEVGLAPKCYPGSFSDWISYDENEIIIEGNEKKKVCDTKPKKL